MGTLISNSGKKNYVNEEAVENLIHYITRSRINEQKEDLIGYGAVGICEYDPEAMIEQMKAIMELHGDMTGNRRMYHEFYVFTTEEILALGWNSSAILELARCMAEHYYRLGHVVVYAVHKNENSENGACVHIHFAVCGVSYMDGRLFQETKGEFAATNIQFNMRQKDYEEMSAIRFVRPPMEQIPLR